MAEQQPNKVKVCVVEEQEIYQNLYLSLASEVAIELQQITNECQGFKQMVDRLSPDLLLVSTRRLDESMTAELEQVRSSQYRLAIVLLLASFSNQDTELLRKVAFSGSSGMALFLKTSLDSVSQLASVVIAASRGQIILDPVFTNLLAARKPEYPFIQQLTPRELEILDLLSRGYTNASISRALFIDLKTVEHHINGLYSKLRSAGGFGHGHPRVNATRLYLEATGELVTPVSRT